MVDLTDFIEIMGTRNRLRRLYKLFCDACNSDRGYGKKQRAGMLCKKCAHAGKDYLHDKRGIEYRQKMSLSKKGQIPWCKGKIGVYTECALQLMREAAISRSPLKATMPKDQKRIKGRCLTRMARAIKSGRDQRFHELFGYSFLDFKEHMEVLFQEGMSWTNHGEWHIDHITPDSWFSYETIEDFGFKQSWNLSNIRPLWKIQNLIKSNRHDL